jgi:hypothetical protein
LKINLKGLHFADVAEIQAAVTDEVKNVQKEEFSAAFQKLYDRAKACIYANGAYFELKKPFSVFKKISPKTFGPHCVCTHNLVTTCFGQMEKCQVKQVTYSDRNLL